MLRLSAAVGGGAFAGIVLLARPEAATPTDGKFERLGTQRHQNGIGVVTLQLVYMLDRKPVTDAVMFERDSDMGTAGMPTMPAPMTPLMPSGGIDKFAVRQRMTRPWELHCDAGVPGETDSDCAGLIITLEA